MDEQITVTNNTANTDEQQPKHPLSETNMIQKAFEDVMASTVKKYVKSSMKDLAIVNTKNNEKKDKQFTAFVKAMVEINKKLPNILAEAESDDGSYKYATLTSILAATRILLADNGIISTFNYATDFDKNTVTVQGALMHVDGYTFWSNPVSSVVPAILNRDGSSNLQAIGSATTYLRRYIFCSMLNIQPDKDDDGACAVEKEKRPVLEPLKPSIFKTKTPDILEPTQEDKQSATTAQQIKKTNVIKSPISPVRPWEPVKPEPAKTNTENKEPGFFCSKCRTQLSISEYASCKTVNGQKVLLCKNCKNK